MNPSKADTFIFQNEQQVAKIRVRRGQSVAILGTKGVMVRDPGPGEFEVDVVKLKEEGQQSPFPLALLLIPSEHSFAWANMTPMRASFLLAEVIKAVSTVH